MKYLLVLFGLSSILALPNPEFKTKLKKSNFYTEGNFFAKNCVDKFVVNFEAGGLDAAVQAFKTNKYAEDSNVKETCAYWNSNNNLLDQIIALHDETVSTS
jgi:hypothetical protein